MRRCGISIPIGALSHQWTLDPLVCIRRLLGSHALPSRAISIALHPVTASGTAARAQQPEQARGPGKGDGEPDDDVHAVTEGAVDVVFFEGRVEGAHECGVEDCRREGKSHDEQVADAGDDGGGEAAPAAEEGGDADENFEDQADYGDDVGDEHPFAGRVVGVEAIFELGAEEIFHARVVQSPDLHGVEPELRRAGRAVGYLVGGVGASGGEVARAVIP